MSLIYSFVDSFRFCFVFFFKLMLLFDSWLPLHNPFNLSYTLIFIISILPQGVQDFWVDFMTNGHLCNH